MKKLPVRQWLATFLMAIISIFVTTQTVYAQEYIIATDTTYAPFEWTTSDGQLTGLDIDIIQAIAKDQGFTVSIQVLGFNAALQALESKQVDGVIAGMGITPARQQTFAMSNAYFEDDGIVMGVVTNSDIASVSDLSGKKVAAKIGTAGATLAQQLAQEHNFSLTLFEDSASMIEDVLSGNSVALFEDSAPLSYAIASTGVGLKTVKAGAKPTTYGFASRHDESTGLVEKFNTGLANIKANGIYDQILTKYFGSSSLNADTTQEVQREDTSIPGIVTTNSQALLDGLLQTILLAICSIVIAIGLGIALGLLAVSQNKVLEFIYTIYVDIIRGTPLLVQAFFVYFALPQMFGFQYVDAFLPSLVTLAINASAYIGELFRGGIQAVDHGQFEAARSLGLSYAKTMRRVILPQAMRIMLPSFVNQFIVTLKDTSILSAIGLVELTQTGRIIISRTYASGNTWVVIGLMYIILITLLTRFSKYLENHLKYK